MPQPRIKKGEIIKARFLNDMAEGIDNLQRAIKPPTQINKPTAGDVQNEDPETEPPSTFIESGRTTTTVQVFDQNETNYAEVERIETVTFTNNNGESIKLKFDNT